jgi:hypothetical protein
MIPSKPKQNDNDVTVASFCLACHCQWRDRRVELSFFSDYVDNVDANNESFEHIDNHARWVNSHGE